MQYMIDDTEVIYQTQYSKRKKMELEISPEGHINIKAPSGSSQQELEAFLMTNKKPILKVLKRLENRQYISSQKNHDTEENYLYLGKLCKLEELLPEIPDDREQIPIQLKRYYTKKTKQLIAKRVKYYEKIIGVHAKSFTIVDTSVTWGTCNSYKELTFNYRLSMAPLSSIDYVVIHELCHIMHMNHDRSFWRKVGTYDRNYKEHEAFLNRFGVVMTI